MESKFSKQQIEVYREGLLSLNDAKIAYTIGGAFATYHYTGIWRDTHDLDVYMTQEEVARAVCALKASGFQDLGEMAAGDRDWIYHAAKHNIMLDIIWRTPNSLGKVDESVYATSVPGTFLGVPVRFVSPDILIWMKLFTMNRHRCDWFDIFRIIRAKPQQLNWDNLLRKIGEHWRLLLSCIIAYEWVYPPDSDAVPQKVRDYLIDKMLAERPSKDEPVRESLLDPWIYTR